MPAVEVWNPKQETRAGTENGHGIPPYTYMLTVRIPVSLMEQLRAFVDYSGASITDVTCRALRDYLIPHGAAAGRRRRGVMPWAFASSTDK